MGLRAVSNIAGQVSSSAFPLLAPDGTAAAPSYAFSSNTGTGITYQPNGVGFSLCANGSKAADLFSTEMRLVTSASVGWNGDLFVVRDAANALAQRNGTNAQTFRAYNTFTDASNYERVEMTFLTNVPTLRQIAAGTGTARDFRIGTNGATNLILMTGNTDKVQLTNGGVFQPVTDLSPALGDGSHRFASAYSAWYATTVPNTQTATSYTVGATDAYLIFNAAGTATVTLPAASSNIGRNLTIKTIAAQAVNSNASNVAPLASATLGTAILAATAGKWARLVSDGTNWVIMEGN